MGPSQSLILSLLALSLAILPSLTSSSSHYTNLVFKGCANQELQDSQTLKNLLTTLTSQSSAAKFYKTTAAVNGLFQCRGDLSNTDCNRCVEKASHLSQKLCGKAVAVRVQLTGCYLRYEVAGFGQVSGSELLYNICGSGRADGFGLDTALGEMVRGVGNGGFYAGGYQSVYVLGQCEGDLGGGECVDCVRNAAERAKAVCGGAGSGQVYFQECYVSYKYYPNGVGSDQKSVSSSGRGKNTEKTVAIVMGGLLGVALVVACLLCIRSAFKKKTHTYKFGG